MRFCEINLSIFQKDGMFIIFYQLKIIFLNLKTILEKTNVDLTEEVPVNGVS